MKRFLLCCSALSVAACGGGGIVPPPQKQPASFVFDQAANACAVSADGFIWYSVPAGSFSPLVVRRQRCSGLAANAAPPVPAWARPDGPTHAIFVATSLQQTYSLEGMQSIEGTAAPAHVPVTWLIADGEYLANTALYQGYHAANGDDIQVAPDATLENAAKAAFPWYAPSVSVEGAGHERDIAGLSVLGEMAFWGITWNSHGIDGTFDQGAPWGSYCADPQSYKRPAPAGACALLGFEWTARDLDRAYLSGQEAAFSSDPDDLLQRAAFSPVAAQSYVRALVDAYAAAGESTPLVMMSQQESAENTNPGDFQILGALYAQAAADGMKLETLSQAARAARDFSSVPRAIAFPFIAGGAGVPSVLDGGTLYPATIDYHDRQAMFTFVAGQTMPARAFEYLDDPQSSFDEPDALLPSALHPTLENVTVGNGSISLEIQAPRALHYGVALWADPSKLGLSGSGITPAGHAGVVLTFDLQLGANQVSFSCTRCAGPAFSYST